MNSNKIKNVKGGLLSVKNASQELQLHEEYLRCLARQKKIPAYKVRGCWMFVPNEVRQALDIAVPNIKMELKHVSPDQAQQTVSINHLF